jgi:thymidylate synthase
MNKLDLDYQNLLKDILENGTTKETRNGDTISVFGRTIRYKFKDGKFPLLTTKKMYFKGIVTELLWFLRGETNIKYLVDNGCHIWDGDAYKNYLTKTKYPSGDTLPKVEFMYHDSSILSQEEFVNRIKTDDEFAKKWGELGPIYGKQWRNWGYDSDKWREEYKNLRFGSKEETEHLGKKGIDQIANLINDIKTNPDSRRLMVSAWNVGELDQMVLPPCHYGFQVYTRELSLKERKKLVGNKTLFALGSAEDSYNEANIPTRAISLMWSQRSCDLPLGIPANIMSYALLLMMIAKQVNMVPDELIGNLGDCHIYLNQIDGVKEQLTREPYELPTVKLSGRIVNDLSEYTLNDIVLENYQSHPTIKMPLSN